MTRDESLHPFDYGLDFFIDCKNMKSKKELDKLINKIYDDFESRTCKNCKHSGLYTMGWMPCLHPENEYHIKEVHDAFGCNKWEC